jgi:hypothetical protein
MPDRWRAGAAQSGISEDISPACRETPVRDVLSQNSERGRKEPYQALVLWRETTTPRATSQRGPSWKGFPRDPCRSDWGHEWATESCLQRQRVHAAL